MATIQARSNEKIFQLQGWGGLHESPDGDTKLKFGEAAEMWNFRVTRDGNLQRRPGTFTVATIGTEKVKGIWSGYVNGELVMLAACSGKLWKLYGSDGEIAPVELGAINTTNEVHFFGFSNIVYMLNGFEYKQWDGAELRDVVGYRPLVNISVAPNDTSRENLEQVNKLCGMRRMWISPDGNGKTFRFPEKNLKSVDYVKNLSTGQTMSSSQYTYSLADGTITFSSAPASATNSYEIGWTMAETFRSDVCAMRWSELYSGTQDTRVFIYGDGSNEAFYSDIDHDGKPRADYFPDLNEMRVGDENTPITGMIRQYSTLVCFKTDSAWSIQYGLITLDDGLQTAAFYISPTNKIIGNAAPGQVQLVLNAPYTLHGNDVFEWRNINSYSSNLSRDERQAKRISDRVYATMKRFNAADCVCHDDNYAQEFYICHGDEALVYNYAADAWYLYKAFRATCMTNLNGELYFGSSDGKIKHMNYSYTTDDEEAIDAYWESGSMSFGQDYVRKYAAMLWVGVKPENNAELSVTVITDKKSNYNEKIVNSNLANFDDVDFANWSFETNRQPQMHRLKIKAKKFVFYKLVLSNNTPGTTATILSADIRVRFTGYAK